MSRCFGMAIVGLALISANAAFAEEPAVALPQFPAAVAAPAASPSTTTSTEPVTQAPATAAQTITVEPLAQPVTLTTEPIEPPAAAEPPPPPTPTLIVNVDLARQRMVISENGEFKYEWPVSSGVARYPTPRGTFRPQWAAKMWYSRQYDWAPMPNAVFISNGVAVHATYATGALGSPASHGCIRLSPANAKTFYKLVHRHGLKMTEVTVHGTPNWRGGGMYASAPRRKKAKPIEVATTGGFFWFGSPAPAEQVYSPKFIKKPKAAKAPPYGYGQAPKLKAYRQKSTGKIVYFAAPPNNSSDW